MVASAINQRHRIMAAPRSCLVPPEYGRILAEHAIVCRPSLDRMDVAESAVVLHWQGTDSNLKPVLVTKQRWYVRCFCPATGLYN